MQEPSKISNGVNKKTKLFSSFALAPVNLPHLIEAQLSSYQWFMEKGLKELFTEISPVKDYSGKDLSLSFLDYYFDEPKQTERKAKENGISYEAHLRAKVRLENKKTGEIKEQEIYLGDFPVMTKRGTFIVNGVERVIVSQIVRSPGIFFTADIVKGKKYFGAKVIPNRGAWIEFETDTDDAIYVRIDRKRKIPVTALLKVFGLADNDAIRSAFPNDEIYIPATLKKDSSKSADDGCVEIYKRIRPGDLATIENARTLIQTMFFSLARYDLSGVGRYKYNLRLHNKTSEELRKKEIKPEERVLSQKDIVLAVKEIIRCLVMEAQVIFVSAH